MITTCFSSAWSDIFKTCWIPKLTCFLFREDTVVGYKEVKVQNKRSRPIKCHQMPTFKNVWQFRPYWNLICKILRFFGLQGVLRMWWMFRSLQFHSQTWVRGFMKLVGQHFLFLTVNKLHKKGCSWNVTGNSGEPARRCMHSEEKSKKCYLCCNFCQFEEFHVFKSSTYSSSARCHVFIGYIYITPYFSCWGLVQNEQTNGLTSNLSSVVHFQSIL